MLFQTNFSTILPFTSSKCYLPTKFPTKKLFLTCVRLHKNLIELPHHLTRVSQPTVRVPHEVYKCWLPLCYVQTYTATTGRIIISQLVTFYRFLLAAK